MPRAAAPGIFRRLMRRLAFLLLAFASLSLLACKSPCRQLSEKLCECQQTTTQRNACQAAVGQEESRVQPTETDQGVCQRLLDENRCDCHNLQSAEGKIACGLARPPAQ